MAVIVVLSLFLPAGANARENDRNSTRCAKVEASQFPSRVVPEVLGIRCEEAAALLRRVKNAAEGPRLAGWSCRTRDRTDYSRPRIGNLMHTRCARGDRILAWNWLFWV